MAVAERAAAQSAEATAEARRIEAVAAQQKAEQEARRAQAGELAVHAQNALVDFPNDPSLALLLAISSVETTWRGDGYVTRECGR